MPPKAFLDYWERPLRVWNAEDMTRMASKQHTKITILDLYPDLSEEQRDEAVAHLRSYVQIVLRICERIEANPEAKARFRALTDSKL